MSPRKSVLVVLDPQLMVAIVLCTRGKWRSGSQPALLRADKCNGFGFAEGQQQDKEMVVLKERRRKSDSDSFTVASVASRRPLYRQ
jgi:hypothetical protein